MAAFLLGPPLSWYRSQWFKAVLAVVFFALSTGFFLYRDSVLGVTWLWTFVAVFVASQGMPRAVTGFAIGGLSVAGMVVNLSQGVDTTNAFSQAVTIASLGLMMMAFSRQLATIRELRQTQHELLNWNISAAQLVEKVGLVAGEIPAPVAGADGVNSLDQLWELLLRAALLWYAGFALWTVLG